MDLTPPSSQPSDIMKDPFIDPISSQTETEPSELLSEPSEDFVDLTNNLTALDDTPQAESAVVNTAEDAGEIPRDEPSDDFVDILGSETEAPHEEVAREDVAVVAATESREMTGGLVDPLGDPEQEGKEAFTAPVIDVIDSSLENQPPVSSKVADPLVDLLSDPPPAEAKKSSPNIDLFEDEGSDLFAESRLKKSAKQPQKSLFGEPDEDLFGEPLGAASKKSTSQEQKDKPVTAKVAGSDDGSKVAGPLQESTHGDIFTQKAVSIAPSVSSTPSGSSKTNGVRSEDEANIFAGECTDHPSISDGVQGASDTSAGSSRSFLAIIIVHHLELIFSLYRVNSVCFFLFYYSSNIVIRWCKVGSRREI